MGTQKKLIWQSYGSLERVQGIGNEIQAGVLIVNLFVNQYSSTIRGSLSHHITTTCFCWMVEGDPKSSNNATPKFGDLSQRHADGASWLTTPRRYHTTCDKLGKLYAFEKPKEETWLDLPGPGSCPSGGRFFERCSEVAHPKYMGTFLSARNKWTRVGPFAFFLLNNGNCATFALLLFKKKASSFGNPRGTERILKWLKNICILLEGFAGEWLHRGFFNDHHGPMVINHISQSWDDPPKVKRVKTLERHVFCWPFFGAFFGEQNLQRNQVWWLFFSGKGRDFLFKVEI